MNTTFAVTDVEALDWSKFRCASIITSEGDVETFWDVETWSARLAKLKRRVFTLYGGHYDFFFLPPLQAINLSGSGILRAQHGNARLYDAWYVFQMSLAKIGKAVGIEKFENKSNRVEELSNSEVQAHCEQDCRVLAEAIRRHRDWCLGLAHPKPRWPSTAGGTAVYALEALEPEGSRWLKDHPLELTDWLQQHGAASGARIELWQVGRVRKQTYCFDLNSSYPFSWGEAPLPMGPYRQTSMPTPGKLGVYRCTVKQDRSKLPIVAPDWRWQYNGDCWCTSEELEALAATSAKVEVLDGWESETSDWFGRHFAERLYAWKLAGEPGAKVAVNSGHGKTGQGCIHETYYRTPQNTYVVDRELSLPDWYQRPLIEGYLLARARLRLGKVLQALLDAGWHIYYCDTDCVHTDCPPDQFPGVLSDACGAWKLEAAAEEAVYVAPKVYGLRLPAGKTKLVAKGFPREAVTWEALCNAAAGFPTTIKFRGGLKSFRSQTAWRPEVSTCSRVLCAQTGGKRYVAGTGGKLSYQ